MALISSVVIRRSLGSAYDNNFFFLPIDGTRGGILVAAKDSYI
jgi:hypothetical protein